MKRKIVSIILLACSVFAIFSSLAGLKDCKAIQTYKQLDRKQAERVSELEDAIQQLQENEEAYWQGRETYEAGQPALEEASEKLENGQETYDAGVKKLEEGKAAYAAGQQKIEENTQAYEEGKKKLEMIEPLLPYVDAYIAFRDGTVANLPGFDDAQAWFSAIVIPLAAELGLDIPSDVTDFPAYIEKMVADGKAQIQQYDDGLVKLEESEITIAEGEQKLIEAKEKLEEGYEAYDAGKEKMVSGKQKLDTFEDGMTQVNEFTNVFFTQPEVYRHNGELAIPNTEMRLGEEFSWIKTDAEPLLNGEPYLDLDKCMTVCLTFREFFEEQVAAVSKELHLRMYLYIALIAVAALGMITGIFGLLGKGKLLGMITAAAAVCANIFGMIGGYTGYTYRVRDMGADGEYLVDAAGNYTYTYSGTLQLIALIALAFAAIVFTVIAAGKKEKTAAETAAQ